MSAVILVVAVALGLGYVLRRSKNPRATGAFRSRADAGMPWMLDDGGRDPNDSTDADFDGGSPDSSAADGAGDGGGGGGSE